MSLRSKLRLLQLKVLNDVQVAAPCSADWNEMEGDDKVRYCGECRLHVFNLSAMDLEEAAERVSQASDRLCVRFFRRHDGTVLTRDCPVGVERKARRRRVFLRASAAVAGAGVAALGLGKVVAVSAKSRPMLGDAGEQPVSLPPRTEVMMGAMAAPPEVMGKLARP